MNVNKRGAIFEPLVWTLYFSASLGSVACGGRAVDSEQGSEERDTQKPQSEDSIDDAPASPDTPNLQRLGECKGGHEPAEGACPWVDGDSLLCFPTKEDACACICPLDRDSVCVSGFYNGADGQTAVYCN
jgi:hypothetical protein